MTVIAEYRHLVAGDTVYARNVDKALIHENRDHMRDLAAYQHRCVHLGKAEGKPVAVADAYGRDARVLIERQPFAVAETIPGTALMHGGDIAAPRSKLFYCPERLVRSVHIQAAAYAHRVHVKLRVALGGGRAGNVLKRYLHPSALKLGDTLKKARVFLLVALKALRRGEVGEHTVNDYIIARRAQLRDKSAEFLSGDKADAVQSRIYFNMNMRGLTDGARRCLKLRDKAGAAAGERESGLDGGLKLEGERGVHHKDALAYAAAAQLKPLGHMGHGKAAHAVQRFEHTGDRHKAETVSVVLEHGDYPRAGRKRGSDACHVLAQYLHVHFNIRVIHRNIHF